MEEFDFPANKKEFLALDQQEQFLLVYLFGKRVLQAIEELQNFSFGMFFNMPKAHDSKVILNCFRVLSYTPTHAMWREAREEYEKTLAIADTRMQVSKFGITGLVILAGLIFSGTVDPSKLLGG